MIRLALVLAALGASPLAAQTNFTLPPLCADLAVTLRLSDARDHRRATFEVRNLGPGAFAGGRGAVLRAAMTSELLPDETSTFAVDPLPVGQSRSYTLTRAGHDGVTAWALIESAGDCNAANNTALATLN